MIPFITDFHDLNLQQIDDYFKNSLNILQSLNKDCVRHGNMVLQKIIKTGRNGNESVRIHIEIIDHKDLSSNPKLFYGYEMIPTKTETIINYYYDTRTSIKINKDTSKRYYCDLSNPIDEWAEEVQESLKAHKKHTLQQKIEAL